MRRSGAPREGSFEQFQATVLFCARCQTARPVRERLLLLLPDGELHEVGAVVSTIQVAGFEVRHLESLREHYAVTLRAWVANLEANWEEAVAEVGSARARVWRLYMAASALNFEAGRTQVHQVLAVRADRGRSGVPLRPRF